MFYVGKGIGKRIQQHEQEANKGSQSYKSKVIRKVQALGERIVKTKVALFETHEDALLYEQALIFFMRPYGHLINLTDGGEGCTGREYSEETRRKISIANKGYVPSEENRRAVSLANKGKVFSEETLRKRSATTKGRPGKSHSEESRRKMSVARKGRERTEKQMEQLRDVHRVNKGRILSEEHRRKVGAANKGRPSFRKGKTLSEEHRRKISESHRRRSAQKQIVR